MKKIIFSLLLVTLLLFSFNASVFAYDNVNDGLEQEKTN